MTFGAMAAWQAWTLIAAAAGLAAWLFLRRLKPPRLLVASLLLWRRVLDEPRALTIWERIRRAVSLVLAILIAAAIALAIARPAPRSATPATSGGRVLIVLDSSWSMRTETRSGESRWERAIAEARRIAAAESVVPVALATTADGLIEGPTTDTTLLDAAMDRAAPSGGDPAAWPALAGADTVHFITDGAAARRLPAGVVVHSVFETAANVGITAFDVRPSAAAGEAAEAYLEVGNFAPAPQSVRVIITRGAAVILDRRAPIGTGETLRQVLPIARGGDAALHARVEAPRNALAIDDDAFAWMAHARTLRVTVVGRQSAWLRPLLTGDPEVTPRFVDPSRYELAMGDRADATAVPDLYIFDRWSPPEPGAVPAIYVAPPPDTPWLAPPASGEAARAWDPSEERRPRWETAGSHPVVRGVDAVTFRIEVARPYGGGLTPVARSARGTPLVSVSETGTRRLVVIAFGPDQSNLASAPGFPVLMGNARDWLVQPDARPSQPAGLAAFTPATGAVIDPAGHPVALARVPGAALAMLRQPGLYVAAAGGARSTVAVNVADPQISNTARTTLGPGGRARAVISGGSERAWWLYAAAAAFILALVEWWTWQRRITV